MIASTLKDNYNFIIVSQEQLEQKLKNSDVIFRVAPQDDLALFILFIKFGFEVSVM